MIKISTRARYGTRSLVQIAQAYPHRAVPVREMAKVQHLSAKYLEQAMSALKAAGLIRSVRGTQGGYELTRPPAMIRLSEVIEALEGAPVVVECVGRPEMCPRHEFCPTRDLWVKIRDAVTQVLDETTLETLAEGNCVDASAPLSYVI